MVLVSTVDISGSQLCIYSPWPGPLSALKLYQPLLATSHYKVHSWWHAHLYLSGFEFSGGP